MGLELQSTVTHACQPIGTGVLFRLFDLKCTTTLQKIPPDLDVYEHTLPSATERAAVIAYEDGNDLKVCQPTEFMRSGRLLKMKVRLPSKCPWFNCGAFDVKFTIDYSEATSPFNTVYAATLESTVTWAHDSVLTRSFTSNNLGDPFGYGSTGAGSCTISVTAVDDAPDNPCDTGVTIEVEADITGLGIYPLIPGRGDVYNGTPEHQEDSVLCNDFRLNTGHAEGFWNASAFPLGPVGLVMVLSWKVEGVPGSGTGCE